MTEFNILSRSVNPFASHFLEASAGTGKTFAIEHLVARLLIEGDSPFLIEEILVVTFTRAATRELKTRIYRNLKQIQSALLQGVSSLDYVHFICEQGKAKEALERIDAALICYDRAPIYTLHGFCFRLLQEFGFEAKMGYCLPDPDREDTASLVEKWVKQYLKEESTLDSYSPFQVQQLLKKYQRDPTRLISSLSRLSSEGKSIADSLSYFELLKGFVQGLQRLPSIEKNNFIQDFELLTSRYVKMTSDQIPLQIQRLSEILFSKQCTPLQFDRLLQGENFLEKMQDENLKKKIKPLDESALYYPGLLKELQITLLPWLSKASDCNLTFLRLAKQIQEKTENLFAKEELFSPDALLTKVQQALEFEPFCTSVRKKFKSAIIDEFQDTDLVQWSIVKTLFLKDPKFTLYLVGDPKQSIYAFRSADVYVYLDAACHMGRESKKYLNTNFRSTPALVEALNALFSRAQKRWMSLPGRDATLDVHPVKPGSCQPSLDNAAPIQFFVTVDKKGRSRKFPTAASLEKKVYPYLASEIFSLHTNHFVAYHDIAILIKDRFQGQEVADSLKRAGIPVNVQKGTLLTDSEGYISLKEILKAVYSPYDIRLVRSALATPLIGWSEDLLKKDSQSPEFLKSKAEFKRLQDLLLNEGFGSFFSEFLETSWIEGSPTLLQTLFQRDQKSIYFDLRRLCELILEEPQLTSSDYLTYLSDLKFNASREDPRLQVASAEEKGSVTVMTMHRSKGLEFEVVFALGLSSRQSPSDLVVVRQDGRSIVTALDEEDAACKRVLEEADAEKQRLLYVALTRAKRKLYIPLFLEEEKQTLSSKEASPIELFLSHWIRDNPSHEELYATARELNLPQVLPLLQALSPHVETRVLQEAPLPVCELDQTVKELVFPQTSPLSFCKQPLLSFTALSDKSIHAEPIVMPQEAPLSIHTLPLGSETGIFIHYLFEKILKKGLHHPLNFVRIQSLIVQETQETPFEPWQEVLFPWILDLLQKPFLLDVPLFLSHQNEPNEAKKEEHRVSGFALIDIPLSQMQCEVEFLYPCQEGLMKGFADLFFLFEEKYYILDWKTNYLGPSDEDYTQERMQEAIKQHQYDLQASIYKEALERYVKLFDKRPFSSCFGGAIYYFVRGKGFVLL